MADSKPSWKAEEEEDEEDYDETVGSQAPSHCPTNSNRIMSLKKTLCFSRSMLAPRCLHPLHHPKTRRPGQTVQLLQPLSAHTRL